jgi:hypothetical protein
MFVNVNGEEIFIGAIPANAAPELREAIESEYEASGARDAGTRFTSEKEGQVKSKLPGRILNLPDGKFADLNTILEKYPDVKLITTVVTNETVTLAGLEKAGLSTSDIVITNPENLAAAGKNKEEETILKGGYVYALVPAPDGRYFPVKLFTKKVGEVENLKNKVSGLVDGLYNSNPEVAEDALSQLKDLIHINRDKSNFKIKLEEGSVLVNGQKAEQEKLKETLLSTKQGEGVIAFINKAKMNSDNYNADVAEYLNHNMDVSVGIHSPSYKVNAQFTAPVKQSSERSKEIVVDETATQPTQQGSEVAPAVNKEQSRLNKRVAKAKSDFNSATTIQDKVKALISFLNNATISEASVTQEDMSWYEQSKAELEAEGYVLEDEIGRELSDNEIYEIRNKKESDQVPKGVTIVERIQKPRRVVDGKQTERPIYDVIVGTGTTTERDALAAEVESIKNSMTPQNIKETRPKLAAANKALQDYDAANFPSPIQTEINIESVPATTTTEGTVDIPVNDMTIVYNPQTGEMTFKTTGGTPNETVSNKALVRYEATQGTLRRVTYNNTKYAILSDDRIISLSNTSTGKEVFKTGPQRNKILKQAGEVPTPVQPAQQTSEVKEIKKEDLSFKKGKLETFTLDSEEEVKGTSIIIEGQPNVDLFAHRVKGGWQVIDNNSKKSFPLSLFSGGLAGTKST